MKNDELKPYKHDRFARIPSWAKILFLKFWAAGAAFYFSVMGILFDMGEAALLMFFWLILTLIQDYIVRQIVKMMRNSKDDTFRYNMVNITGARALFLNAIYVMLIIVPMIRLGNFIISNGWWFNPMGVDAQGNEPILVGLLFILVDGIAILIKNAIIRFIDKRKNSIDNQKKGIE